LFPYKIYINGHYGLWSSSKYPCIWSLNLTGIVIHIDTLPV
jgi:hypothetical protein